MVEDLKKWQNLIDKHDSLVWKLERSKVSDLGNRLVTVSMEIPSFKPD